MALSEVSVASPAQAIEPSLTSVARTAGLDQRSASGRHHEAIVANGISLVQNA